MPPDMQPPWIGDLLRMCAVDDWSDTRQELGHSSVSPMFRKLLPHMAETEDVSGYSSAELRACREGLEVMAKLRPQYYAVLSWEFQPWKRRHMERDPEHDRLVVQAGMWLANYVDQHCE